jgi:hypothetical protein
VTGTDRELVLKKLARIEECVQELRTLGDPSLIRSDRREERFVEAGPESVRSRRDL